MSEACGLRRQPLETACRQAKRTGRKYLVDIHRWGWGITLHPDGTVTATSPDGRTLHSHSPPPKGGSPLTTAA